MSEENQVNAEQQLDEVVDYKAMYEEVQARAFKLESDLEAVAKKKNELLHQKKLETDKRRQAEDDANREKLEKSKKEGDYESVVKSYEAEKKAWQEKYENLNKSLERKEIRQKAIQLANDLKPLDTDALETLADYIEKRIKVEDGNTMYLDSNGNVSVMQADDIKKEFSNSNKFKPLLKGSQATGGGAPGANSGAKADGVKQIKYEDYESMNPMEKLEVSKLERAGKVVIL